MFKYKLELKLDKEIKNCTECPLCFLEIDFEYDTETYTCTIESERISFITSYHDYDEEIEKMTRPKNCPLKKV